MCATDKLHGGYGPFFDGLAHRAEPLLTWLPTAKKTLLKSAIIHRPRPAFVMSGSPKSSAPFLSCSRSEDAPHFDVCPARHHGYPLIHLFRPGYNLCATLFHRDLVIIDYVLGARRAAQRLESKPPDVTGLRPQIFLPRGNRTLRPTETTRRLRLRRR